MSVYVNVRDTENENFLEDINIDNETRDSLEELLEENNITNPEFYSVTFDGIDQDIAEYEDFFDVDELIDLKNRYNNLDESKSLEFLQDIWSDSSTIDEAFTTAEEVDALDYEQLDVLKTIVNDLSIHFDTAFRIVVDKDYAIFNSYEDLGIYYAEMYGDIPDWLEPYIDYEKLGEDYFADEEYGVEGEYGYYIIYQ